MIMVFIIHFYITFGTNLLTGGPARIAVFFAYFSVSQKRNIKRNPNRTKPSRAIFLEQTQSKRLVVDVKLQTRRPRVCPVGPKGVGVPPPSWAPRGSTNLLLPTIYTHIPQKHPGSQRNTISTAVTFCIREIPSWSLRRRSAGGGLDHGGLLHQHHSPSDEL